MITCKAGFENQTAKVALLSSILEVLKGSILSQQDVWVYITPSNVGGFEFT